MASKVEWQLLGYVGVESGALLLADPFYIAHWWKNTKYSAGMEHVGDMSFGGVLETASSASGSPSGQLTVKTDAVFSEAGVAIGKFGGDGLFPVYAKIVKGKDGYRTVSEVRIKFTEGR